MTVIVFLPRIERVGGIKLITVGRIMVQRNQ